MELALHDGAPTVEKSPWHLWAVGALTLVWSVYGAARFLAAQSGTTSAGAITPSSDEFSAFAALPIWAGAFWALNAWGMLAGSAMLFVRSSWAVQSFVVALFGLAGMSVQLFVIAEQPANIYAMPIALATWIITMVSLLYASRAQASGFLR